MKYYMARNNFVLKSTLTPSHAKMHLKSAPEKLNFLMARFCIVTQSYVASFSRKNVLCETNNMFYSQGNAFDTKWITYSESKGEGTVFEILLTSAVICIFNFLSVKYFDKRLSFPKTWHIWVKYCWNYEPSNLPFCFTRHTLERPKDRQRKIAINSLIHLIESYYRKKCLVNIWRFWPTNWKMKAL